MRWLVSTSLFLSLLVSPLTHAANWGERGVSKRFAIDGNRLYSADGRGVSVYDISDSAAIRRIDVESGDDESLDVARMGASDLVLATRRGVDRFAVASDGTLTRLGTWEHEGGINHVATNDKWVAAALATEITLLERKDDTLVPVRVVTFGNPVLSMALTATHLFVTVESEGIHVIDPLTGGEVALISHASEALALSGSTLWSASFTGGLIAIDIRNPLSPVIVSTTGLGTIAMDGVAVAGSRVYVFRAPNTIHFFDATNVAEPQLVATRTEWVNVAAASGTRLFFTGPRTDRDRFTYETGTPVRVFDATDLSSPRIAGEVHDLAGPVSGVWTDGSLAYVVDAPYFRVLDVSRTDAPRELTSIELPYAAPQLSIRVKNGVALVYGREYVHLIDVSDPVHPRLDVTWDPRGHSPDDVAPMADGLFVEVNEHSGIHVVDYEKYDPPAQVGGRIMHFHAVAAGDDAIYVLSGVFLTMSLTDRAKAQDVTLILANAHSVDTAPPNADRPPLVVLRQGSGIRTYSLREDRFHPREIAFAPAQDPGAMATAADSLVVDIGGTLNRLEFSNPTVLVPIGLRVTSAMQISMAGEKIVVADRYRVRVYGPDTPPPPSTETSKRRSVRR